MSESVANGLRLIDEGEMAETIKFVDNFDKFFDCLNVSNLSTGKEQRKPFKQPYYSANDFRLKVFSAFLPATLHNYIVLQWLNDTFLKYLSNWETSVELRDGYQFASTKEGQRKLKPEQLLMLLSQETRQGLCITSRLQLVQTNTYHCY